MTKDRKVEKGNFVKVDYIGKFDDGEVFDSSKHGNHSHPLEFQVGSGQVIKGFDNAVMGMKVGETKNFSIGSKEAYGEYREEMKKEIPRNALPKEQEPRVGMILVMQTPQGQQFPAKIVHVGENTVTVDLNHPLAGKKLNFEITIAEINDEPSGESHHHGHGHGRDGDDSDEDEYSEDADEDSKKKKEKEISLEDLTS